MEELNKQIIDKQKFNQQKVMEARKAAYDMIMRKSEIKNMTKFTSNNRFQDISKVKLFEIKLFDSSIYYIICLELISDAWKRDRYRYKSPTYIFISWSYFNFERSRRRFSKT